MVGIGGGVITGGGLILIFQSLRFSPQILVQLAFGTSHFATLAASALAAYRHSRGKNLLWRAVIPLGLSSMPGAVLGARLASVTPGSTLKLLLGIAILAMNLRLFLPLPETRSEPRFGLQYLLPIGLGIGFLASLLGIGGGVISVPVMALVLSYPIEKVAGVSAGTICFTALAASISYTLFGWRSPNLPPGSLGYLHLTSALPILGGSLLGVQLGVWLHRRADPKTLRLATASILTLLAIRLLVG